MSSRRLSPEETRLWRRVTARDKAWRPLPADPDSAPEKPQLKSVSVKAGPQQAVPPASPSTRPANLRAHDFGQSGWLAILTAIPYLGFIASLVFIFIPGQPGQNQFGPNPKGV